MGRTQFARTAYFICRLRVTRNDFGARSLSKSTWFRTRNIVADDVRGPKTNIKTPIEYWLWCVGDMRVEVEFLLLFIRIVAIDVDIKSGAREILFKKGI